MQVLIFQVQQLKHHCSSMIRLQMNNIKVIKVHILLCALLFYGFFLKDWDRGFAPPKRIVVFDTKSINCEKRYRYEKILRFPWPPDELPRANALRGLI